jgi:hypothetical protein
VNLFRIDVGGSGERVRKLLTVTVLVGALSGIYPVGWHFIDGSPRAEVTVGTAGAWVTTVAPGAAQICSSIRGAAPALGRYLVCN